MNNEKYNNEKDDIIHSSGSKVLYPPPIDTKEDENNYMSRREFLEEIGAWALLISASSTFYAWYAMTKIPPSYVPTDDIATSDFASYLEYRSWILNVAKKHFKFLVDMSKTYGVSPELIMGTISSEMFIQSKVTELGDNLKLFFRRIGFHSDPSIGFGQIKISTALELNKRFGVNRSEKETIKRLMNMEGAIEYITFYYKNISRILKLDNLNDYVGDPYSMVYLYATYIGGPHPNISAITNGLGITGMLMSKQDSKSLFDIFKKVNDFDRAGLIEVYDEFSKQINPLFASQSRGDFTTSIFEHMLGKDVVPANLKGNTHDKKRQYLLDYIKDASDVAIEKYHDYIKHKARHNVDKQEIKRIRLHRKNSPIFKSFV